jgi:hypothetical protein
MNWELVGVIADVVATIAVIASVVYLAFQIKQQAKSEQVESVKGNIEGDAALLAVAQDGELAQIFVDALREFSLSDPAKNLRFSNAFGVMLGSAARQYENVLLGFSTEAHFQDRNHGHLVLLETRGGSEFWHRHSGSVPPEFREFVNRTCRIRPHNKSSQQDTSETRAAV